MSRLSEAKSDNGETLLVAGTIPLSDSERMKFDLLKGRVKTREGSLLTAPAITSSASLLLFTTALQATNPSQAASLLWLGFFFGLLGLAYRELTILTADARDHREIRRLLAKAGADDDRGNCHNMERLARGILIRSCLYLPPTLCLVHAISAIQLVIPLAGTVENIILATPLLFMTIVTAVTGYELSERNN